MRKDSSDRQKKERSRQSQIQLQMIKDSCYQLEIQKNQNCNRSRDYARELIEEERITRLRKSNRN